MLVSWLKGLLLIGFWLVAQRRLGHLDHLRHVLIAAASTKDIR